MDAATCKVTTSVIDVRHELAALGLTPEQVIEALLAGETERALCTPNDPPCFHGIVAWARSVRRFREVLLIHNWTKDDTGNFSTVVNPDKTIAISVATGDKETGIYDPARPFIRPRLKYPKGNMTREAVDRNWMHMYLFPEAEAEAKAKAKEMEAAENRITWMLVRRRESDKLFAELSLPAEFDGGHVENWRHRIIIGPLDLDPLVTTGEVSDDGGDVSIDFEVRRRA